MELQRSEILPGVFLNSLQTDKFKSDCLSVNLLCPLDRETVSKNALLPRVLSRGTAFHPDMDAISAACDELYGARIIPCVRKLGEILCVGFYAGFLADRFTPDGSAPLEPVSRLLGEMLLSPATRAGLLRRDYVENEKEKLLDDIRARLNDKRGYAIDRLVEEMCAFEPYGCDVMGTEADAESVGYVELTRYYHTLLQTAPVEVFYIGAADAERAAAAVRDALITLPRGEIDYDLGTDIRMNAVEDRVRHFDEEMDVAQGKLCMGFRLGTCMDEPDFAAIRMFNALFGGAVTSRLFLNVREKLSLCYYAVSSCDTHKGLLFVSSGIEPDKLAEVRAEIFTQLEALRRCEITDEELTAARRAVVSSLRSLTDSAGALEDFYLGQVLRGLDYGPEEFAALCESVTAEDAAAVARSVEEDAEYFLHGPESGDEEENCDAET